MCYATGEESSCDDFPAGNGSNLVQGGDCSDGNCAVAVSLPHAAVQDGPIVGAAWPRGGLRSGGPLVEIHLGGGSYRINP